MTKPTNNMLDINTLDNTDSASLKMLPPASFSPSSSSMSPESVASPASLTTLVSEPRAIVSMKFWSGQTARIIFILTESILENLPITCYANTFEITHARIIDEKINSKVIISFKPRIDKFLHYQTCPELFKSGDHHMITPLAGTFSKYVGSATKKDSIDLYVLEDDKDLLYADIIKPESTGQSVNTFRNANIERKIVRFKPDDSQPNIRIPLCGFCDVCCRINRQKKDHRAVFIRGYERGVKITGDGHKFGLGNSWGCTDEYTFIGQYYMSIEHNRAMMNVGGICERGIINMHFDSHKIRMVIPASYYGDLTVILDNGIIDPVVEDESDNSDDIENEVSGWFK